MNKKRHNLKRPALLTTMLALLALLLVPSPKAVHCFIPTFAWSSDDRKLALIDEVEGEGAGKFLVIIPVNSPEQSRQFKILPKQSAAINTLYPNGVKLTWQGSTSVTVSTANGEKCKELPFTKTWEERKAD